jgi:hypothetical protein
VGAAPTLIQAWERFGSPQVAGWGCSQILEASRIPWLTTLFVLKVNHGGHIYPSPSLFSFAMSLSLLHFIGLRELDLTHRIIQIYSLSQICNLERSSLRHMNSHRVKE